ncbi:flavin-dependent monooxygenase [Kineobactrum salinum]|nr:flavin-dependent monooxygenase [Kineobactrum salinum]
MMEANKEKSAAAPPDLVNKVRGIMDEIATRADDCEANRVVPVENIQTLHRVGLLDSVKPKKFGGLEVSPPEMFQAFAELAGACPSTAWVSSLLAVHAHAIAYYDPRLQEEIWGDDPEALIGSSIAPLGKLKPVEGGYRLSGRFPWSSGCDHVSWCLLGALIEDETSGQKLHGLLAVPRADYQIEDTWYSSALKGTGSKDVVVNDVFVPGYRAETLMALNTGTSRGFGTHKGDIYTLPFQPIFASNFSAVAYGIAESALDVYRERLQNRVRAYTGAKASLSPPGYMRLAESYHEVRAARLILESEWNDFADHAARRAAPTLDTMVRWRTSQAYATRLSVSAVDRLMMASGGSAILLSSKLQRCFRDVHGAAAHAYSDYDIATQILGRHLIGAEPDPTLL